LADRGGHGIYGLVIETWVLLVGRDAGNGTQLYLHGCFLPAGLPQPARSEELGSCVSPGHDGREASSRGRCPLVEAREPRKPRHALHPCRPFTIYLPFIHLPVYLLTR